MRGDRFDGWAKELELTAMAGFSRRQQAFDVHSLDEWLEDLLQRSKRFLDSGTRLPDCSGFAAPCSNAKPTIEVQKTAPYSEKRRLCSQTTSGRMDPRNVDLLRKQEDLLIRRAINFTNSGPVQQLDSPKHKSRNQAFLRKEDIQYGLSKLEENALAAAERFLRESAELRRAIYQEVVKKPIPASMVRRHKYEYPSSTHYGAARLNGSNEQLSQENANHYPPIDNSNSPRQQLIPMVDPASFGLRDLHCCAIPTKLDCLISEVINDWLRPIFN